MNKYGNNTISFIGSGVAGIVCFLLLIWYFTANNIIIEDSIGRFVELSGGKSVKVVRHSNNWIVVGDRHDVSFELLIDGKPVSGRCESGLFSPMICRMYNPGQGE